MSLQLVGFLEQLLTGKESWPFLPGSTSLSSSVSAGFSTPISGHTQMFTAGFKAQSTVIVNALLKRYRSNGSHSCTRRKVL